ncbi:type II secretion system secretin GspD, partial [Planctomycetota bacterium]
AGDRLVSLDLNQVDLRIFIKTVGQMTGVNFFVDDKVKGTVTLMSPSKVPLSEVYNIFESVLDAHGFAAVPAGSIVKILPREQATRGNMAIHVGMDPEAISTTDRLVTQIIPLRHIKVEQVNSLIASLVGKGGQATAFTESNTLILTDTSASVHRVVQILKQLDVESPKEEVEIISLRYASAVRTSEQIMQIMERAQSAPTPAVRGRISQTGGTNARLEILPDDRTNALIVTASPEDIQIVRVLVEKLDVESPMEAGHVHVVFLQHAEAVEIEKSISAALGRITGKGDNREGFQVIADESTNALIVVAAPQDYQIVKGMIDELDVIREQVLVEFQIVEAGVDVLKDIGVDWATLDGAVAESIRGFGYTSLGPRIEHASGTLEGLGIGLYRNIGGETQIGAILKALEKDNLVNFISTPHILTSNHKEATIVVADNVPYVQQSRVTEFDPATPTAIQTFNFKDVGIELKVTPHVSAGSFVRMEIDASFSKLIEGATGLGASTPTTAQRKATTVVTLSSGATVVIGGLMRDEQEEVEKKVPLLGDIPALGALFKTTRTHMVKTNLLLFITPHVLTSREEMERMTERKSLNHPLLDDAKKTEHRLQPISPTLTSGPWP